MSLTIQPVISADRRFVRLNFGNPFGSASGGPGGVTLTNLVPGVVATFPVVVPIFSGSTHQDPTEPVVFTQFIQQPVVNTINIETTVAVPDGGTVVMGGLKRLSEARSEYGPPILSKIPYINRLFKNVGYGRSAESLLIMVTPRIIIQEEEEERQTGFHLDGAVGAVIVSGMKDAGRRASRSDSAALRRFRSPFVLQDAVVDPFAREYAEAQLAGQDDVFRAGGC